MGVDLPKDTSSWPFHTRADKTNIEDIPSEMDPLVTKECYIQWAILMLNNFDN